MAIEGPLRELGIHDVFQLLDLSRKTGVLTITSRVRQNRGVVYFEHGAVVHAGIQANPHPLGGVLLRAGKIAEADLHRARAMQQRGDTRRLGEILVAIGALARREVERQVRLQIEEVVFEVMSWREGYFSFIEGPLDGIPAEATVRIPTGSLLLEAARRIDEWSRIESHIPRLTLVPHLAELEGEGGWLDLLPAEWEVLAAIDGQRDLRAIGRTLRKSEFDVARTVFGLESAGVVALKEEGMPIAEGGENRGDLQELLDRVEDALARGDAQDAVRLAEAARGRFRDEPGVAFISGRASLVGGRIAEAEEAFRHALRLDPLMLPAHRFLGDALAKQGKIAEAVEWWERWLTLRGHGNDVEADDDETAAVRSALQAAHTLATFLQVPHE
jgi:hypothetical protein